MTDCHYLVVSAKPSHLPPSRQSRAAMATQDVFADIEVRLSIFLGFKYL